MRFSANIQERLCQTASGGMSIQIVTLKQGEGPDTPNDGDIVIADVEIWDLDCNQPDNHNKGKMYVIQITISVYEGNICLSVCNWESFKFQVGEIFAEENERFNFLHDQVKDMFVNAQTRLTQTKPDDSGYVSEVTLRYMVFKFEQDADY
ncbi:hypothetical protein FGG08_007186 [Glutinoglossum americanum]|uniref:Uncharacterized protein n=1 Tax=Glutinoglossum americanum TaxID=1670608 RepID=A0A9P8HUI1_9PEZI|nr:hypothetical protein FGG08_007186 [Glutinoglossum americanum]